MKLVMSGDIHLHEFKDFSKTILVNWNTETLNFEVGSGDVTLNSRLYDALNVLIQARHLCEHQNIKHFVIAGDLFHKRGSVSTLVYNMAYRVLESFKLRGISVTIIAGNHDQVSNVDVPENSLFGLKGICKIVSQPERFVLEDNDEKIEILGVPYSSNKDCVLKPIQEYTPTELPCILVTHVGVTGAFTGKKSYVMTDAFSAEDLHYEKFKYVAMGHYHKPQVIIGTDNMFYTGAPLQHNYNDEGELRGVWIVDTKMRYDAWLVPLESPKFITLTKDNFSSIEFDPDVDFVKISDTPNNVEWVVNQLPHNTNDSSEDNDKPVIKIELQKELISNQRSDINIGMSYPEIIRQYALDTQQETNNTDQCTEVGIDILTEALSQE